MLGEHAAMASWQSDEHDGAAGWTLVQRDWSARSVSPHRGSRAWSMRIAAAFAGMRRRLCGLRACL